MKKFDSYAFMVWTTYALVMLAIVACLVWICYENYQQSIEWTMQLQDLRKTLDFETTWNIKQFFAK